MSTMIDDEDTHRVLGDGDRDNPTGQDHNPSEDAIYLALNSRAITDQARRLIETLRIEIESFEAGARSRKYQSRGAKLAELHFAIGAFVANLLRAEADQKAGGWCYRSTTAETFTGEPVSQRTFGRLMKALTGLGLLVRVPGYRYKITVEWNSGQISNHYTDRGKASRFKATQGLLTAR